MPVTPALAAETLLEHAAFVRAVARAVLRAEDLVDDAVQETWIVALERAQTRRGPLRPWLGGVARLTALRLLRTRARARRRDRSALRDDIQPSSDDLASRVEIGRVLTDAVVALPEPYREMLLLRFYEGLTPKEIALRLSIPLETVRTRLKRGVSRLRNAVEERHPAAKRDWRAALVPLAFGGGGDKLTAAALLDGLVISGGLAVKKIACVVLAASLLAGAALLWQAWAPSPASPVERAPLETAGPLAVEDGVSDTAHLVGHPVTSGPSDAVSSDSLPFDLDAMDRERDIAGVVLGDGDEPLARAKVQILRHPWRDGGLTVEPELFRQTVPGPSRRTASDGTFGFTLAPGELVYLRVEADGYVSFERARLTAGERVVIHMRRGVSLVVALKNPDGSPASGVPLLLYPAPLTGEIALEREATTDERGLAAFEGLPPAISVRVFPFPRVDGVSARPAGTSAAIALPESGTLTHEMALIEGYVLIGRITDAVTGVPVSGAKVSTWWNQLGCVKSGEDGRYALPGVCVHPMLCIHVIAEGYGRRVAKIGDRRTLDVTLERGRSIVGRVVDADGNAIGGALLRVYGARPPAWLNDVSLAAGVSGEDGSFRLGNLAGDIPHTLIVKASGHGKTLLDFDPSEDGDVLALGDVRLSLPTTVCGRLLDTDGSPMTGRLIEVAGWNADRMRLRPEGTGPVTAHYGTREHRLTDDLGRFCVTDLAPGSYAVRYKPPGRIPLEAEVETTVAAPLARVDLCARARREVVVTILDTSGEPVHDALVRILESGMRTVDEMRTPADGKARFHLPQRALEVAVYPRSTSPHLTPPRVTLRPTDTVIELRLSAAQVVAGRLLDEEGEPLVPAYVTVELDGPAALGGPWYALTGEGGRFAIRLPLGGTYSVRFDGRFRDPDHPMRSYCRPLAALVEGLAGETRDLLLRAQAIPEDRSLRVRLLDPDGKPVEGTRISMSWWRPGLEGMQAETDAQGRARFDGLPPLPVKPMPAWTPSVERPWVRPEIEGQVPAGQEIEIRLRRGVLLTGRVEEAGRAPPVEVYVVATDPTTNVTRSWARTDADGRFALVLDPDERGVLRVKASRRDEKGGMYTAVKEGVRPGDAHIDLRLEKADA